MLQNWAAPNYVGSTVNMPCVTVY